MRVVGGVLRGRPLSGFKGRAIRPTSDRVREAIFNVLCARGFFSAAPLVLDLYAGSGALGIEALSRGAKSVVFVDSDGQSARLIRKNITGLGLSDSFFLIRKDAALAMKDLERQKKVFDIIFLDPPYSAGLIEATLAGAAPLIGDNGIIVAEGPKEAIVEVDKTGFVLLDEKVYGDTMVSYLGKCEEW